METDREKRDKLASARRKLNEYKQNRSSTKASPAVSTKPADVPLFYQNINNPPPLTQNFFNPSGTPTSADNNNVPPTYAFFTPTPTTTLPTTTETISSSVAQANYAPPPPLASATAAFSPPEMQNVGIFTPNSAFNVTGEQQFQSQTTNFFGMDTSPTSNPPEASTNVNYQEQQQPSTSNASNSITNPFAMPLPTDEPSLLSAFSTVGGGGEEQSQVDPPPISFFNPATLSSTSDQGSEMPISSTALFDVNLKSEVGGDFIPSAPPVVDVESSPSHLRSNEPEPDCENQVGGIITTTEEVPEPETDIPSNRSVKTENSENTDPEVQQAFAEREAEGGDPPVNMFASSIFGSSPGAGSGADDVFNLSSGTTSKTFELLSVSPLTEAEREAAAAGGNKDGTMPSIFNPISAATQDYHQDQELPVFEVIEKSDLLQATAAVQNDCIQQILQEPDPVIESLRMGMDSTPGTPIKQPQENVLGPRGSELVLPSPPQKPLEIPAPQPQSQSQEQNDRFNEAIQQMKSVQDALELQMQELQRENTYLLNRQTELTLKIEDSERLAHEFKLEKDRVKEESLTTSQALRAKINSLCEENQRIVKNSTDIGVDLRAKLEEKSRQLEEMQKAAIILSQSKMDFASRLDHEEERVKELQKILRERDEEIVRLNSVNTELQEKLKQEQQKDAVIHQLQDQARHYQVQNETLHRELESLRHRLRSSTSTSPPYPHPPNPEQHQRQHHHSSEGPQQQQQPTVHGHGPHEHSHEHEDDSHNHSRSHDQDDHHHHHDDKEGEQSGPGATTSTVESTHDHDHEHGDSCDHHDHDHDHSHSHDHDHHHHHSDGGSESHQHSHDHGTHEHDHHDHDHGDHSHDHHHHHHDEEHAQSQKSSPRGPLDELTELKKTLHRLQWENSSFRNELDVLAVDAKQKRTYEEKCLALEEENLRLKKVIEQLEHVIIQLQGENDTIGDYITLYQSQKLALRECAKEKDAQLEQLAREREMLLHRLAELTALVQDLKESKSEAGSQCADVDDHNQDHDHTCEHSSSAHQLQAPRSSNKHQIEGKIRDLLTEISSSTLIENFHPCALCSGRLMTV